VASNLTFDETGPSVSLEDLQALERRYSIALTEDYAQFLVETNGGQPSLTAFDVPDWPGKRADVHYLFELGTGKYGLEYWIEFLRDDLPEGMIPIAVDLGGNFICLELQDPYRGDVYYWDSSPDHGLTEDDDTLFLVAESFREFLSKLYRSPHLPSES
jgi:hypothetical protein